MDFLERQKVLAALGDGDSDFVIGVVEEVVTNPSRFINVERRYTARVTDPTLLSDLPPNTILARIITDGEYNQDKKLEVCYPLFSTHLQIPIKNGEYIFIFRIGNLHYWASRIPGMGSIEDVNYTHHDRAFLIDDRPSETEERQIGIFNNGGETQDLKTFVDGNYDDIFRGGFSTGQSTYEPVPQFLRRPGDLVLQGSNNSLICLGQQRGWTKHDKMKLNNYSNSSFQQETNKGAIDIVVGRGRYMPAMADGSSDGGEPIRTACRTLLNERRTAGGIGSVEAMRMWQLRDLEPNNCEGDPDYEYDSARIMLGMEGTVDTNFAISFDDKNKPIMPPIKIWNEAEQSDKDFLHSAFGSHVVAKADHVRIIARHQKKDVNGLVEGGDIGRIRGTIRLVKEGIRNSEAGDGQGVISMEPDGTILIDGPTVVLGGGNESLAKENGEGTHIVLGYGATEPIVLGNELKDLLDQHFKDMKKHIDQLKTFLKDVFNNHTHTSPTGETKPPSMPATGFIGQLPSTEEALDASIEDLVNTLSKFGKIK